MAAEVTPTKASGDEVSQEHIVPNLMTRSRMEHKLETLRRDREHIEHAIMRLEQEAEKYERPVNQDLINDKSREIRDLNEQIEAQIQALQDLNKGINPEREEFDKKKGDL